MHMPDILNMCSKRGALIVLEGCDRAGKSTQVKLLTKALNDLSIPVEARAFPSKSRKVSRRSRHEVRFTRTVIFSAMDSIDD